MIKKLSKFELPKKLIKKEKISNKKYAMFIAEPFTSGFGHTIGNSLRRILLSSLEGAAIYSLWIEGVNHEFQSIDGVVEDVIEIIMNLKKVLFVCNDKKIATVTIDVEKDGIITASDINCIQGIDILNKDQIICHLSKKRKFKAELQIKVGRGYVLAEENKEENQKIGIIPIDSLFSPVKLVKYNVENTRVGQITDFDKLILEIWTDGRITPENALKEATVILKKHLDIFDSVSEEKIEFVNEIKEVSEKQNRLKKLLNMSVNEIELSVRAANCLNNANITSVGQLCLKTESEMLKYRNFGKKSLNEFKEKLEQLGLSLGMKIDERLLDSPLIKD